MGSLLWVWACRCRSEDVGSRPLLKEALKSRKITGSRGHDRAGSRKRGSYGKDNRSDQRRTANGIECL